MKKENFVGFILLLIIGLAIMSHTFSERTQCFVWQGNWSLVQNTKFIPNNSTTIFNEEGFNNLFLQKMIDYSPADYSIFMLQSQFKINATGFKVMQIVGSNNGFTSIRMDKDSLALENRIYYNFTFTPKKCTKEWVIKNL